MSVEFDSLDNVCVKVLPEDLVLQIMSLIQLQLLVAEIFSRLL